ncbi:phosphatidylglycerophosphatase A family protein [Rhodovulum sp. DZ06]|uniref:phosphatidylglycerophosphatase A family protein n=1 Tax=Rhodovulum sp. DZ06 TaxID=3425126 RepID=UPI003D348444
MSDVKLPGPSPLVKPIATFFGAGLSPKAPGTVGSLAGLGFGMALQALGGPVALLLGLSLVIAAGFVATELYMREVMVEDPQEVVIDEVAGQLIALLPLSIGLWYAEADPMVFFAAWPGWVGAFLAFRLFDIWKPWLVGRADRMHGAVGVMLDDLVAGVFAAILVIIAAVISHGVLM